MLQVQYLVLLIIETLALVTYIPGNIFIVFKNIQDWTKNKKHSPFLQLILGVSGINIAQGLLKVIATFLMKNFQSAYFSKIYGTVCLVLTSCSIWFSTWLCMYYCLQTVQIKIKIYRSLQKSFPSMVPWLHLLSLLVSSALNIPVAWKTLEDHSSNTTLSIVPSNTTSDISTDNNGSITFIGSILEHISYAISSLAFLLMLSSSMAIIISFCINIRHVNLKAGRPRSQDAEASVLHKDAAKAVSCIVGFNVFLYAANILTSVAGGAIWTLLFSFANTIFQNLTCLNLIKGHVNLSNMSVCCLCNKKYFNESEL